MKRGEQWRGGNIVENIERKAKRGFVCRRRVRGDTVEGESHGIRGWWKLVYEYDSPLHISRSTLETGGERRQRAPRQFHCARSSANLSDDFTLSLSLSVKGGGGRRESLSKPLSVT